MIYQNHLVLRYIMDHVINHPAKDINISNMEENEIDKLLNKTIKAINAYGKSRSYAMLCLASQALSEATNKAYKLEKNGNK